MSVSVLAVGVIQGCSIEEMVRKNDDRYATPGAMDSPLTGIYSTYAYGFMGRYRIAHEWVNTAPCAYRSSELPRLPNGRRSNTYVVPDIYEADGKTWQASSVGLKPQVFDRWVRSVKVISEAKGREGEVLETGFEPICFEHWWKSSHYLRLRLQRRDLAEFERVFSQRYPEGTWRDETLNGRKWRVQQVAMSRLRARAPNGVGGPYQAWLTEIGDTGYSMAFEMGANQESLAYPKAHADIEAVFMHLVGSLRIERVAP